jgi:soluble cytochrome b562
MMTPRRRIFWFGFIGLALALMSNRGLAALGGDDAKKAVQGVADLVQKGNEAGAKKMAEDWVKKDEDNLFNAMKTMKPRDAKDPGFGVGKPGDKIQPDGIEDMVRELAKSGLKPDDLKKNKDALLEMTYRINAISQMAKPVKQKKMQNQWNKWAEGMDSYSQDLAKAIQAGDAAAVKKAATKLDANCNQCHEKFR